MPVCRPEATAAAAHAADAEMHRRKMPSVIMQLSKSSTPKPLHSRRARLLLPPGAPSAASSGASAARRPFTSTPRTPPRMRASGPAGELAIWLSISNMSFLSLRSSLVSAARRLDCTSGSSAAAPAALASCGIAASGAWSNRIDSSSMHRKRSRPRSPAASWREPTSTGCVVRASSCASAADRSWDERGAADCTRRRRDVGVPGGESIWPSESSATGCARSVSPAEKGRVRCRSELSPAEL
mmetsp:Transcript_27336/g.88273  ORF Transcript_27336/g.88273 Transcript_27336/m.88273 type:complete len:241 (+) Transcript_27336:1785-2507(+)